MGVMDLFGLGCVRVGCWYWFGEMGVGGVGRGENGV